MPQTSPASRSHFPRSAGPSPRERRSPTVRSRARRRPRHRCRSRSRSCCWIADGAITPATSGYDAPEIAAVLERVHLVFDPAHDEKLLTAVSRHVRSVDGGEYEKQRDVLRYADPDGWSALAGGEGGRRPQEPRLLGASARHHSQSSGFWYSTRWTTFPSLKRNMLMCSVVILCPPSSGVETPSVVCWTKKSSGSVVG